MKIHDYACTNFFTDTGPCTGECNISDVNRAAFIAAAEPLMKYLAENHNPHTTAIVTCTDAELVTGEMSHSTDAFLKD